MKSFIDYIVLTENAKHPEVEKITNAFSGFDYSVWESKSTAKRVVFRVNVSDRESSKEKVEQNLAKLGFTYSDVDIGSFSSFTQTKVQSQNTDFDVFVVYKPKSGGMSETTLNSSITELFPVIAYEKGYTPKTPKDFYKFLSKVDVSSVTGILSKDRKAAKSFIDTAETSSKFEEKMMNAIHIFEYLQDLNNQKQIKNVYWGYRAKPKGVKSNHPGDIFVEFTDNSMLGVSLKAGGKKTKEPQLNTYVNVVLDSFNASNVKRDIREYLYRNVYSRIPGFAKVSDIKSYDDGRSRNRKEIMTILDQFESTKPREYNELYDEMLDHVRGQLVQLFNMDKDATLNWIRSDVLKQDNTVPTVVIKATMDSYHEVTDANELGTLIPVVKVIRAYDDKSSKQKFSIELRTTGGKGVVMEMTVRTNKTGTSHKLGQFFNLAVKYNGLK